MAVSIPDVRDPSGPRAIPCPTFAAATDLYAEVQRMLKLRSAAFGRGTLDRRTGFIFFSAFRRGEPTHSVEVS
jgi:hypothetical protein